MIKTKKEFNKIYPEKDVDQTRKELQQWVQHMKDGNTEEVLLTSIVIRNWCGDSSTPLCSVFAYVVSGYHIYYKNNVSSHSTAIYSELTGGMIGSDLLSVYYKEIGLSPHEHLRYGSYTFDALYPITKEMSKEILMVECLPPYFTHGHEAIPQSGISDPVLAMVATIRSAPKENQNRLLMLFDKYGPPNNLLGSALIHIDKFRSF